MSNRVRAITSGLLWSQSQPPTNVYAVAVDMGIDIERTYLPSHIPGFAAQIGGHWTVWINDKHKPRRRRWTISHELGHIALGHQGCVFLDTGERTWQQLSANRFAAELLMPEDLVRREHARACVYGLNVGDLADIFLVDKRVAELRLDELGLDL